MEASMKIKSKLSAGILCLLAVVCILALTACEGLLPIPGNDECAHEWGEWTVKTEATCTEDGTQERECSKCEETETASVDALGHEWKDATCTEPKTCTLCNATEGTPNGHTGGTATCQAKAVCSSCKKEYGGFGAHSYDQSSWDYKDAEGHAHTCSTAGCNAHDAVVPHISSGAATETDPEICTDCLYVITPATGHVVHTPESEWAYDSDKHWHECTGCESQEFNPAIHTYDNSCDTTCNICPYTRSVTHIYNDLKRDAESHWYECAVCHDKDLTSVEAHKGGESNCGASAICGVCSLEYGEPNAAKHTSSEFIYTTNNDGTHIKKHACCKAVANESEQCSGGSATCTDKAVCENCGTGYGDYAGHTGGNATCTQSAICDNCKQEYGGKGQHVYNVELAEDVYIAKKATCDAPAAYYKSCACGSFADTAETFVYGEALGHDYSEWETENGIHTKICKNDRNHVVSEACSGGEATCTSPAICSTCNKEYAPETDHVYGEFTVTVEPTCTTVGKKEATCSCGDVLEENVDATGHSYSHVVTDPTCIAKGYTTHTCADCSDSYIDTYTDEVDHSWNIPAPTCEAGQECTVCHTTTDKRGHNYELSGSTEATCTAAATKTYTCQNSGCGDTYTQDEGAPKEHNISGVTPTLVPETPDATCRFVQHYECKDCHGDITGQTVEEHKEYFATIVTSATCTSTGTKKLTCKACGYEKAELEIIPVDDVTGHKWNDGVTVGAVTTYTCQNSGCGHTKESVTAVDTAVNAGALKDTELKVENDVNITLGNAADAIGNKDVTISAGKLDKNNELLGLTDAQKEQIGDNPVYDFTMKDDKGNPISSFGENGFITITIPYTLKDTDNVDNIAVWYIADDGTLQAYQATYNNGYITFKTNHFSYYTVTELTPKQRCDLYGHSYTTKIVDPKCSEAGYTLHFCIRCGAFEKTDTVAATGHSYAVDASKTVAATCTKAGKTVYKCETCNHSYSVKTAALKHSWTESERTDATCMQSGSVVYVCTNSGCEGTYTQPIAQLTHSLTAVVVAPTCQETGYTLHKCTNDGCTYSYSDSMTQPVGHEYAYEFVWKDDYTKVDLIVTCANEDCEHEEIIEIDEILMKTIPADCKNPGREEYTVKITHNGKLQVDKKEKKKDNDKLGHAYGNSFEYDATNHWHVCAKCGSDEDTAEAHEYKKGVVVKAPTCSEAGREAFACKCGYVVFVDIPATGEHNYNANEIYSDASGHWYFCSDCEKQCDISEHGFELKSSTDATCTTAGENVYECSACKYVKTEVTPATGEHSYENGKCTSCGALEGSCTHEPTVNKTIDLADFGACGGKFDVITCLCGEFTCFFSWEDFSDTILNGDDTEDVNHCEWDEEEGDSGVDENGNEYMSATITCTECNLAISAYATAKKEQCQYTITYEITMEIGNTVILDKATATYTEEAHGNRTQQRISLDKYSSCGGYYDAYVCSDCNQVVDVYSMNFNCNLNEKDAITEQFTDEKGNVHTVMTVACPDCGLIYAVDYYVEQKSPCEAYMYQTMSIYCGEELIFNANEHNYSSSHEYETEYELNGDTCNDGYTVIRYCAKCDQSERYTSSGCRTEHIEIDLSKYSTCGGVLSGSMCDICGRIDQYSFNMNPKCQVIEDIYKAPATEVVDKNGNVHHIQSVTCPDCGLVLTQEMWVEVESVCVTRQYARMIIATSDETVFNGYVCMEENNHKYEQTVVMKGETCDDGFVITYNCTACGHSYTVGYSGHYYKLEKYELTKYGIACGGYIEVEKCVGCGQTNNYWNRFDRCDYEHKGVNGDGYEMYTCRKCGASLYLKRTVGDKQSDCSYIEAEHVIYYVDGVSVLDLVLERKFYHHNYTYDFTMQGETCEDGLVVTYRCLDCGESHTEHCGGHYYEIVKYDLSEYGMACGGEIEFNRCLACGVSGGYCNEYYNCHFEHQGISDDGYEVYLCRKCGASRHVKTTVGDKQDNCLVIQTVHIKYYVNGELAFEFSRDDRYYQHNYTNSITMNGNSCTDGFIVTRSCKDCGSEYDEHYSHHTTMFNEERIDLSEYGVCGGELVLRSCPCGEISEIYNNTKCSFSGRGEAYVDEDGNHHNLYTYVCHKCGFTYTTDSYSVKANCRKTEYALYNYSVGDTVIVEDYISVHAYESHDYKVTYEFTGGVSDCESGVRLTRTCKDCGYSYNDGIYDWHTEFTKERYELSDYGACGGHIELIGCACGKFGGINYGFNCPYQYTTDKYIDEEGKLHHVEARHCDECGLRFQIDYYTERDADTCTEVTYYKAFLNIGTEYIADFEYTGKSTSHDYTVSAELMDGSVSCEDGAVLTYTCYCGDTYTRNITHHESIERERYDLTSETYGKSYHMGYAVVRACACERYVDIAFADSMCEFDQRWIECWVDGYKDIVRSNTYSTYHTSGYNYYDSYIYTCAVTEPQCGYAIRTSTYYLIVDGQCLAEQWETWQLGYKPGENGEDGTWAYEISIKTGETMPYHRYNVTEIYEAHDNGNTKVSGHRYDCPDCGSYCEETYSYREDGTSASWDRIIVNTLDNGDAIKYTFKHNYDEKGRVAFEKHEYTYADGTVYSYESEHFYYKDHQYEKYSYQVNSDGSWYRYDYEYNFDGTCEKIETYTNSYGETRVNTYDCHYHSWETTVQPTCTQSGCRVEWCPVCETVLGENIEVLPNGHSWNYVRDGLYICNRCALQNNNGADGDIVLEDYTALYGNGENYVAGYWAKNNVQFIYNVSLILHNPLENGNNQIILESINIFELDNVRALAFSKADLAAAIAAKAAELGLTLTPDMYDVRLSFVPLGADERHDYAITFTDDERNTQVKGTCDLAFVMSAYESVNIVITPETSGTWTMYSSCDFDSYGTLYDADRKILAYNDDSDGDTDFKIVCELQAGETYILNVRPLSYGNFDGTQSITVTFETTAD